MVAYNISNKVSSVPICLCVYACMYLCVCMRVSVCVCVKDATSFTPLKYIALILYYIIQAFTKVLAITACISCIYCETLSY